MGFKSVLTIVADVASIGTAFVAVYFYSRDKRARSRNRIQLENYLNSEKGDKAKHTLIHLSRKLGLTIMEIDQAASDSKNIRRLTDKDVSGKANKILLEYKQL